MQHLGKVMARQNAGTVPQQTANLYCGLGCNPFNGAYGSIGGFGGGWLSYTASNGSYSTLTYVHNKSSTAINGAKWCANNSWACSTSMHGDVPQNNSNIPDSLFYQLTNADVSADFLNSVTIKVSSKWDPACWSGNPAITFGNTVTYCGSQWYDTARVSPALVHELVHVRQYHDDPYLFRLKQSWYELGDNSPYEKEAWDCYDALKNGYETWQDLPALNVAPCNLP